LGGEERSPLRARRYTKAKQDLGAEYGERMVSIANEHANKPETAKDAKVAKNIYCKFFMSFVLFAHFAIFAVQ
jgi:hypothetical protein